MFVNTGRPLKVTIKPTATDKQQMLDSFLNEPAPPSNPAAGSEPSSPVASQGMPVPQYLDESDSEEGWITFDKPILYT